LKNRGADEVERRLLDMIEAIERIERFTTGRKRADLDTDDMLREAVLHSLQTIGEAGRHVPNTYWSEYDTDSWVAMVRMRNRIVHGYAGVNNDIVWQVVATELAPLLAALHRLLTKIRG
jgi:uncharacterized protein with HEPN domain